MTTIAELDDLKQRARDLLARGMKCKDISRKMGVSYRTVHRWLMISEGDYEAPWSTREVFIGAKALACTIYERMGISQRRIADVMEISQPYVHYLLRYVRHAGSPVVFVELLDMVADEDRKLLRPGVYRCYWVTDERTMMIRNDKGTAHFVPYRKLVNRVEAIKWEADYEEQN